MSLYDEILKKEPKNVGYIEIFRKYYAIINRVKENEKQFFDFLDYSNHLYKYNADEILMMYCQNPNALAIANFNTWKKVNNPVKKGQRGYKVVYLNSNGYYEHFTVFDISQTVNPQMPFRNWRINQSVLETISVKLFNTPDFSKGLAKYYQSLQHRYNPQMIQLLSEYLIFNKIDENFSAEKYKDVFRSIQTLEISEFVNMMNFIYEQNKVVLTRVYQLQIEIERTLQDDRSRYFQTNRQREERFNQGRTNENATEHFERKETTRTPQEVFSRVLPELRRGSEVDRGRTNSMGVRTVLRGGRDTTLQTENANAERRPQIESQRENDSRVHDGVSQSGLSSTSHFGNGNYLSDRQSGRNAELGDGPQSGNHSGRNEQISETTQQNAILSRELSDTDNGIINRSGTSESRISTDNGTSDRELRTEGAASTLDGRGMGEPAILNQENLTDESEKLTTSNNHELSLTEDSSVDSNNTEKAEVEQTSISAFSFEQKLAYEDIADGQLIQMEGNNYQVGEVVNRTGVKIILLTNIDTNEKTKFYWMEDQSKEIYLATPMQSLEKSTNNELDRQSVDELEEVLTEYDGYIRLNSSELLPNLPVIINDEPYLILSFEDYGSGIGNLSLQGESSTTSFVTDINEVEIYAKEEDLKRIQQTLTTQNMRQHDETRIRLESNQYFVGMKVWIDDKEWTITGVNDYHNGLGTLNATNGQTNFSRLDVLERMEVYTSPDELKKFEQVSQLNEVAPEETMSFFQEDTQTDIPDESWNILTDDYTFKEIGDYTFLVDNEGNVLDFPIEYQTYEGHVYYKELEIEEVHSYETLNLFDFESEEPVNGSLEIENESVTNTSTIAIESIEEKVDEVVNKVDFTFDSAQLESFYGKTPKERIQDNIHAIQLLKKIESENRLATSDEQEVLAKYVGWGGLSDLIDENKTNYQEERQTLSELLTPSEYSSVRESILTAYYTDPKIIQLIYHAIEKTGFNGGNILDPAMGTGNFFSAMPSQLKENSNLYGVELDSLTARIAKQLHQNVHIQHKGFENTKFLEGSFDLVVGNVPFADFKLKDDKTLNEYYIHDYFVKRSLDLVHEGGIVAVITSTGTLDKRDSSFRREISKKADLIGAVRLPNTAFKHIAGTEVNTDILFFQKREERSLEILSKHQPLWIDTTVETRAITSNQPRPLVMNLQMYENIREYSGEWYLEPVHQNFRGGSYTFVAKDGVDYLSSAENQLIDSVDGTRFYNHSDRNEPVLMEELVQEQDFNDLPIYTYFVEDGDIKYFDGINIETFEKSGKSKDRMLGMIQIRDMVRDIISYQQELEFDSTVFQDKLSQLNQAYDSFYKQYGYLNDRSNMNLFSNDDYSSLLASIETPVENAYEKADIFFKPTVKQKEIVQVNSALEALHHSLSKKGRVDIDYMLTIYDTTKEALLKDLDQYIFELDGYYETRDQYLSGDVKTKLETAKNMATLNPKYQKNVRELEKVIPEDLGINDIHVEIGSRWLPKDVYSDFLVDVLDIPKRYIAGRYSGMRIEHSELTDTYFIKGKSNYPSIKLEQEYGTSRMNALEILERTLNFTEIKVYDTTYEFVNGEKKKVRRVNTKETILAKSQQEKLKYEFNRWIFKEPTRAERLVSIYNERFNRIRQREYNGDYLQFEDMNINYQLYEHQKNVVARIVENGKALMAHEVGAGKTASMISAGMIMKEQGLIQKPLYVVPNHLTEQFGQELLRFYPTKKVLVTTKKDFEKKNRKKFVSRIATGDYDAIIIGHSQFEKINVSKERRLALIEREVEDIRQAITEEKAMNGNNWTVKQMVAFEKKLYKRLNDMQNEENKDKHLNFEDLGVDFMFVDEAHTYKNLQTYTKLSNVAGINTSASLRASDMYNKCQYLLEKNNGRGVVFATGTPISNSMSEFYVLQKYLQPEILEQMGIKNFDGWASTFGEIVEALEISPEGSGFRTRTRFAKFHNLPELMSGFTEIADIQTSDMLNLNVPKIKDGKAALVVSEPSEFQKEYMLELAERADKVRSGCDPRVDNMLKITNEAKLMAVDARLLDENSPIHTGGKLYKCAENVFKIWQENTDKKSTQLIFSDIGTPKPDSFNVYDEMRRLLTDYGIPKEEIAFIHEANNDKQREELFEKVRNGEVRVLLGSTEKLGTGTNVQHKLLAVHHLDVPWRPSDLTQRDGRIVRQGNENKEVQIYRYVAKDSFDSYLWQIQENKIKFINQVMTSRSISRSAEDIDQTLLSASEAKAIATGNPKILEKINLDKEVMTLQMLESSFNQNKIKMNQWLDKYPEKYDTAQKNLQNLVKDNQFAVEYNKTHSKDEFKIKIGDNLYTEKDKAISAIALKFPSYYDVLDGANKEIGEYKGFKLSITSNTQGSANLIMEREAKHVVTIEKNGAGTFTRMDNVINAIPISINSIKNEISELERKYTETKEQLNKPFEKEQELKDLMVKQTQLNLEIELVNSKSTQGVEYKTDEQVINEQKDRNDRSSMER